MKKGPFLLKDSKISHEIPYEGISDYITPRLNGERVAVPISEDDYQAFFRAGRGPGLKAAITDRDDGKRYLAFGADCGAGECYCDAVIFEIGPNLEEELGQAGLLPILEEEVWTRSANLASAVNAEGLTGQIEFLTGDRDAEPMTLDVATAALNVLAMETALSLLSEDDCPTRIENTHTGNSCRETERPEGEWCSLCRAIQLRDSLVTGEAS